MFDLKRVKAEPPMHQYGRFRCEGCGNEIPAGIMILQNEEECISVHIACEPKFMKRFHEWRATLRVVDAKTAESDYGIDPCKDDGNTSDFFIYDKGSWIERELEGKYAGKFYLILESWDRLSTNLYELEHRLFMFFTRECVNDCDISGVCAPDPRRPEFCRCGTPSAAAEKKA